MKKLLLSILVLSTLSNQVNAQSFRERLLSKMKSNATKKHAKAEAEKKAKAEAKAKADAEELKKDFDLNPWHNSHKGKIVFYRKQFNKKTSSSSADSKDKMITEMVIGGNGPFGFRAYLGKNFRGFPNNTDGIDVRYTIGGQSLTVENLREMSPRYYYRMASLGAFFDYDNGTASVSLQSPVVRYHYDYNKDHRAQEDAFKMLLSKVKSKLTRGASLKMKVEIIGMTGDVPNGVVMATGEIKLKVTGESYNIQNLNCRCGRAGMKNASVIKEVKSAFEFQFNDVKKVHKVVLLGRDFELNYDNSYPVKNVTSRGMWANIVYEQKDGFFQNAHRYVFFKKNGSGFSKRANIGKLLDITPVSPTCAK